MHSPCMGHGISEGESSGRKAWRMTYGWWGGALHEIKDGLMGWSHSGKRVFLFQEAEDRNYFRRAGLAVHPAESFTKGHKDHQLVQASKRTDIWAVEEGLPALQLGNLASRSSSASCYLASVSS